MFIKLIKNFPLNLIIISIISGATVYICEASGIDSTGNITLFSLLTCSITTTTITIYIIYRLLIFVIALINKSLLIKVKKIILPIFLISISIISLLLSFDYNVGGFHQLTKFMISVVSFISSTIMFIIYIIYLIIGFVKKK